MRSLRTVGLRHVGYPLAFAAAFGLTGVAVAGYKQYRGGARQAPTTIIEARAATPAARGRQGAESPELRALRLAEGELFGVAEGQPFSDDEAFLAPRGHAPARIFPDPSIKARMQPVEDSDGSFGWKNLRMPSMPVRRTARVERYIRYFTQSQEGRKMFVTWLRRSGRYRDIITKELRERHMPEDLISLVFIESGFWPTAVSTAGATGLWQFMPQTARAYGLTVSARYDERKSIWRSTEAGVAHLADLHERFGSWDLALAAYNMGYKQLSDRMAAMGVDDFWSLSAIPDAIPRETALYVPKILAVAVILHNLDVFDLDNVDMAVPVDSSELDVSPGTPLATVARAAGTSVETLRMLNPEIARDTVPDEGRQPTVHVPSAGLARAKVMLPRLLGSDADGIEDRQSAGFDWGRDEITRGRARADATASRGYFQDDGRREMPRDHEPRESKELRDTAPRRDRERDREREDTPVAEAPKTPAPMCSTKGAGQPDIAPPPPEKDAAKEPAKDAPKPAPEKEKDAPKRPRTAGRQLVFYKAASGDTVDTVAARFGVRSSAISAQTDLGSGRIERGTLVRVYVPKSAMNKKPKARPVRKD